MSPQKLGALNGIALNRTVTHVQHTMQTLSIAEILPFQSFKLLQDVLTRKTTVFTISTAKYKRHSHENSLLHSQIKARPRRRHNHGCRAGAACRLPRFNELIGFVLQHSVALRICCTAQPAPAQVSSTVDRSLLQAQGSASQHHHSLYSEDHKRGK